MSPHLIKKYPNRRLYDTESSKYVTLAEVKELITSGACVKVIDSNTGEDITRNVLLQIIMEAESAGEPMFSSAMLQQIIRFYGGTLQGLFAKYLEESLLFFNERQFEFHDKLGVDPMTAMTSIAEQNMKLWSDFQASLFGAGGKVDKEVK